MSISRPTEGCSAAPAPPQRRDGGCFIKLKENENVTSNGAEEEKVQRAPRG